jgi:protein-S-isoprenylcysteine O-methyltransferase Ste14
MHVGLAVVVLMALFIRPRLLFGVHQDLGTLSCLGLVILGLAGRAWAAGCAGPHTRQATIEAPRLVTGGPFAYVRNPIYLASIVLGLGMVGLLGDPWMLIPYAAVFAFLYSSIVPAEEELLLRRFGERYAHYRGNVGRIVPRLRPWSGAESASFAWNAVLFEARLGLLLAAIYGAMHGAVWLRSTLADALR